VVIVYFLLYLSPYNFYKSYFKEVYYILSIF